MQNFGLTKKRFIIIYKNGLKNSRLVILKIEKKITAIKVQFFDVDIEKVLVPNKILSGE